MENRNVSSGRVSSRKNVFKILAAKSDKNEFLLPTYDAFFLTDLIWNHCRGSIICISR